MIATEQVATVDPIEGVIARTTSQDLLTRLRMGFRLNERNDNPRVRQEFQRYVGKQKYMDAVMDRAERYMFLAVAEAERRGIPTELALLPIIESAYDPLAVSRSGAVGIWQFVPNTAGLYGLRDTSWFDARRDPLESTRAAYDYLAKLYQMFNDWELVLAAYNAGPGTVQRAQQYNRLRGLATDYWSLSLPDEPSHYVPRFLALLRVFNNPDMARVTLRDLPNEPYFRTISPTSSMSLKEIATLLSVPVERLRELNPGLKHDRLAPHGPYMLHIPNSVELAQEQALLSVANANAQIDSDASKTTQTISSHSSSAVARRYTIQRGDTWFALAKRFGLSVPQLQAANQALAQVALSVGQVLSIPTPAAAAFAMHWPTGSWNGSESLKPNLTSDPSGL